VQVPTLSWDTFFGGEHAHSADGDERLYIKIDIEGLAFRVAAIDSPSVALAAVCGRPPAVPRSGTNPDRAAYAQR
jgi:hypothetical protein